MAGNTSGRGGDRADPSNEVDVRAALAAIDRDARSRLLATLVRAFGDLDLAEDAIQEAVVRALRTWPTAGIPDAPEAWLTTVAKRCAVDALRRERTIQQRLPQVRVEYEIVPPSADHVDPERVVELATAAPLTDDRLGMFFACAHPVLTPRDRVGMTLRFVAGLTTAEVAQALLVPVPTMQQRIVRAKQRIRTLGIPFTEPGERVLTERLGDVQRVIYLLYSEGYARTAGAPHVRDDLTAEAIRLARVLHGLLPDSAEVTGLLALLMLTEARRPSRTGRDGSPIPFEQQDRTLWDRRAIDEGIACAERAAGGQHAGPYAIQASIAALHAEAPTFASTDWAQIAVLYGLLEAREPGPVVRLGRAIAVGRALGATDGLRLLDELAADAALERFRPFHIARAVTLGELGDHVAAAAAYRRALQLPGNDAEDRYLLAALTGLE